MKLSQVSVSLLVAIAVTAASPFAEAKGGKGHKRGGGAEAVFERLDADQSGTLVLSELTDPIAEKAANKFDRVDADDDGMISFDEFSATRRGGTDLSVYADEIVQCVSDLKDETGNENIVVPDADDFKSPQEKFDSIDANDDDALSLTEVQDHKVAKATAKFETKDTDLSGDLTLEEFTAQTGNGKDTRKAVRQCIREVLSANESI